MLPQSQVRCSSSKDDHGGDLVATRTLSCAQVCVPVFWNRTLDVPSPHDTSANARAVMESGPSRRCARDLFPYDENRTSAAVAALLGSALASIQIA